MPEWKNVEDELPQKEGVYYVIHKGKTFPQIRRFEYLHGSRYPKFISLNGHEDLKVSHWKEI